MAVQATHLYDSGYEAMFDGGESPTDATAGTYMWVLVEATYDALDTHTTGANFGGNEIVPTNDGQPINATNLTFIASPGAANESFFQAGANASAGVVAFGPSVTISAQYLALVKPVTPGTYATTAELILFIDMTGDDTNLTSTNGDFTITMPTSGWYKVSQA